MVKEQIPFVKTVLGVSNISFGLPAAAREVVNSVFLYHATKAGLDLAIVNAERLERYASLPDEERRLADDLLFNTPPAAAFRLPRTGASKPASRKSPSISSTSPRSANISAAPAIRPGR